MWSRIKRALKKVWRGFKAAVRALVRGVIAFVMFIVKFIGFGFLSWPPKKMKVHIAVLQDQGVPLIPRQDLQNELTPSIDLLKRVYKDYCNVTVSPYSSGNDREIDNWAQIINEQPPPKALDGGPCTTWNQIDEQLTEDSGEWFRQHTAGRVHDIRISLANPITVFINRSIDGFFGCTIPVATHYIVVSLEGLRIEPSTIAHEIGHRCNIFGESTDRTNLMFSGNQANLPPHRLTWWQRTRVRCSRHVNLF
jgi:hypothetical protein